MFSFQRHRTVVAAAIKYSNTTEDRTEEIPSQI